MTRVSRSPRFFSLLAAALALSHVALQGAFAAPISSSLNIPTDGLLLPIEAGLRQHEIEAVSSTVSSPQTGQTEVPLLAIAYTDDSQPTGLSGWKCGFSVSVDNGKSWSKPHLFKREGFELSGNPSVGIDSKGRIYALCMSVNEGYGRGTLDLSVSNDQGKTWSSWSQIIERVGGIPDRPKLLVDRKDRLNIIFTDVKLTGVQLPFLETSITFLQSVDSGVNWTSQALSEKEPNNSPFINGFQGPALRESPNGEIFASWARYYGNKVYFAKSSTGGSSFSKPSSVKVSQDEMAFGVPCTEIAFDAHAQNIVLSVHEGHGIRATYLMASSDGGSKWKMLPAPSKSGTNISMGYVDNRLFLMWTEHVKSRMDTRLAVSDDHGKTFSTQSLAGGGYPLRISADDQSEFMLSLGSYQSLITTKTNQVHAFWLDWRKGVFTPRIMLSSFSAGPTIQ